MIWRRWVTESSSSATQTSSDHLDRRLNNTRMRPPQSGLVQVGLWEMIAFTPVDGANPKSRDSKRGTEEMERRCTCGIAGGWAIFLDPSLPIYGILSSLCVSVRLQS